VKRLWVLVVLVVGVVSACGGAPVVASGDAPLETPVAYSEPQEGPQDQPGPVNLNPPTVIPETLFSLSVGAQAGLQDQSLKVEFVQVTADSRCPMNARCVDAGEAKVLLGVYLPGSAAQSLTLSTRPGSHTAQVGAYQIELVDVLPYPEDTNGIPAGAYVATLIVTQAPLETPAPVTPELPVTTPVQNLPPSGVEAAVLDQPFTLRLGQKIELAGEALVVEFQRVLSDDRCPGNALCIDPGSAVIVLSVSAAGQAPVDVVVNTRLGGEVGRLGPYQLTLKDVQPYPMDQNGIPAEAYEVTLVVEKQ
jgi:hypothetical protein